MKRLILVLVLVCGSGVAAYAVFLKTHTAANQQFDCEISWLSHKLSLTPEQTARVRELHLKYCPTMNGLQASCSHNQDSEKRMELAQACRDSTAKLVEAVSAELTPVQKEKYLQLLASKACDKKQEPKAQPK
jgi:hypothetical protein